MQRARLELADIAPLAASIKRNGLAQPLFVKTLSNEPKLYELFAGYRRWRAALAAKIDCVPVIVFGHLSEAVALELNLLENLNRRDMTIIDEAHAFRTLVEQYGRTPTQIASLSGRTLNQVTNMLSLVALPEEVRLSLRNGQISFAHGRVLVGAADPMYLVRRIVAERLTVRETELLAAQLRSTTPSTDGTSESRSGSEGATPTDPSSPIVLNENSVRKDLKVLQAALRAAIGAEIEVRTDCDDTVLQIEGRSAQDIATAISVLCDAMRLLRTNMIVRAASEGIRTA
jgi:ParB family chromosome partitioning protein